MTPQIQINSQIGSHQGAWRPHGDLPPFAPQQQRSRVRGAASRSGLPARPPGLLAGGKALGTYQALRAPSSRLLVAYWAPGARPLPYNGPRRPPEHARHPHGFHSWDAAAWAPPSRAATCPLRDAGQTFLRPRGLLT